MKHKSPSVKSANSPNFGKRRTSSNSSRSNIASCSGMESRSPYRVLSRQASFQTASPFSCSGFFPISPIGIVTPSGAHANIAREPSIEGASEYNMVNGKKRRLGRNASSIGFGFSSNNGSKSGLGAKIDSKRSDATPKISIAGGLANQF